MAAYGIVAHFLIFVAGLLFEKAAADVGLHNKLTAWWLLGVGGLQIFCSGHMRGERIVVSFTLLYPSPGRYWWLSYWYTRISYVSWNFLCRDPKFLVRSLPLWGTRQIGQAHVVSVWVLPSVPLVEHLRGLTLYHARNWTNTRQILPLKWKFESGSTRFGISFLGWDDLQGNFAEFISQNMLI